MTLHTKTVGDGPDIVLIHGWGLHSGVWDTLVPLLSKQLRVTCVDLPGHGRSDWQGEDTLDAMLDAVAAVVPEQAAWLGWSLGGLLAMRAAIRIPEHIDALMTIASTPSFVRRPDWQSAMLPALLETFASELAEDYRRTLDRFLSLQVRGSAQASQALKQLRNSLLTQDLPRREGLDAGLSILATTDLRADMHRIMCPTLLMAGERDTLVPVNAIRETAHLLAHARQEIISGSGHAPFITHPEQISAYINDFL